MAHNGSQWLTMANNGVIQWLTMANNGQQWLTMEVYKGYDNGPINGHCVYTMGPLFGVTPKQWTH